MVYLGINLTKSTRSGLYLICAIFVHVIFGISIFDVYFKSNVIHGMTPYSNPLNPPAKRLVLIVIDGLRANTFYRLLNEDTNDLFLRYIVENKGIFGVSHAQVPTESRTGHIGLIAGMYEDVSAVLTGWKYNPVEFDSFFNQSRYTWSWGSPDILPIFSKGTHRDHVFMDSYSSNELDFGTTNASRGDAWVFNKVKNFFLLSKKNDTQRQMLSNDKISFFLHLIATDTIGHSKKPASSDYVNNVVSVDKQIKDIVGVIDNYFQFDNRTAYIVTSDHGMTDWGSHGSGSSDETETPIVAWGAGIRGPIHLSSFNSESTGNHLSKLKQIDINQVDIAALMASLIGVPFPLNSVGVLPLEYLNNTEEFLAQAFFANSKQISARCEANRKIKSNTALTLSSTEYKEFTRENQREYLRTIEYLIEKEQYKKAIQSTREFIDKSLKGIHYYDTYDRLILNFVISLGFVGWMLYLVSFILEKFTDLPLTSQGISKQQKNSNFTFSIGFILVTLFTLYFLKIKGASLQYYAYFLIPLALTSVIYYRIETYKAALRYLLKNNAYKKFIFLIVSAVVVLEILIFSFFHREILTTGLIILSFWPWCTPLRYKNKKICMLWTLSIFSLSIFPLLPVVGKDSNYQLVLLSGWLCIVFVVFASKTPEMKFFDKNYTSNHTLVLLFSQISLLFISMYVKHSTTDSLSKDQGLLRHNQILAWTILMCSFVLPFYSDTLILRRLFHIMLSLMPVYLLMSSSYELLFLLCLCVSVFSWILCEYHLKFDRTKLENLSFKGHQWKNAKLTYNSVHRAYFYLSFIFTAFFGTGNIASISSFDPSSFTCFMTVFNPFAMSLLLMLKIVIPFLIVSCSFYAITEIVRIPVWKLFSVVLLMSDFMSLHFFLFVQDTGSWLGIGSSISRYILMMVVTIFLTILHYVSQLLTTKKFTVATFV